MRSCQVEECSKVGSEVVMVAWKMSDSRICNVAVQQVARVGSVGAWWRSSGIIGVISDRMNDGADNV